MNAQFSSMHLPIDTGDLYTFSSIRRCHQQTVNDLSRGNRLRTWHGNYPSPSPRGRDKTCQDRVTFRHRFLHFCSYWSWEPSTLKWTDLIFEFQIISLLTLLWFSLLLVFHNSAPIQRGKQQRGGLPESIFCIPQTLKTLVTQRNMPWPYFSILQLTTDSFAHVFVERIRKFDQWAAIGTHSAFDIAFIMLVSICNRFELIRRMGFPSFLEKQKN